MRRPSILEPWEETNKEQKQTKCPRTNQQTNPAKQLKSKLINKQQRGQKWCFKRKVL